MIRRLKSFPSQLSDLADRLIERSAAMSERAIDGHRDLFRHGWRRKVVGVLVTPAALLIYGVGFVIFQVVAWTVMLVVLAAYLAALVVVTTAPWAALVGVLWLLGVDFGGGSHTSGGGDFCSTHSCISSFDEGAGSIVQCADGMWSHSGGLQGACSSHGGER